MNIEQVAKTVYFGFPSVNCIIEYLDDIDINSVYEVKSGLEHECYEDIHLYISDDPATGIKITQLQIFDCSETDIARKITLLFNKQPNKMKYSNIWNLDNNITITLILNEQLIIEQFK